MSCVLSLLISPTFSSLALVAASALQKRRGRERKKGVGLALYLGHMML